MNTTCTHTHTHTQMLLKEEKFNWTLACLKEYEGCLCFTDVRHGGLVWGKNYMTGLLQSYKANGRNKMYMCLLASILASILMSSQLPKDSAFFQVLKTRFFISCYFTFLWATIKICGCHFLYPWILPYYLEYTVTENKISNVYFV